MAARIGTVNPFTTQDLALAQQIVDSRDALTDFYRRCTNCGLDVKALQEQIDALADYAKSIQTEFGGSQHGGQ